LFARTDANAAASNNNSKTLSLQIDQRDVEDQVS
jgi:hypothetical protein